MRAPGCVEIQEEKTARIKAGDEAGGVVEQSETFANIFSAAESTAVKLGYFSGISNKTIRTRDVMGRLAGEDRAGEGPVRVAGILGG